MAIDSSLSPANPVQTLGMSRAHIGVMLGLALVLVAAPFLVYPLLVIKILCFALFASALNLLLGYVGLLSFGHAAYFGMASYAAAHAAKTWGFTPELAILFGAVVAALLGAVFGALAVRRHGIYFAMVTLAFAQMVYFFALQAPFTGGEDGIQQVPRGFLFGIVSLADDRALYWFVIVLFMLSMLALHRIIHSPFGQALKAIRENEPRATSLGYRVNQYKFLAFVLSAFFAGIAGGMKAIAFQLASLTDVYWTMSGEVVLMTLIGGVHTFIGPVVGAALVVVLQNYFASFGDWVTTIQGVVFVVCVLLFREGIVGFISKTLKRPL